MNGRWVPPDTRDQVVDFVAQWSAKTKIPANQFIAWIQLNKTQYYRWRKRYGKVNEHNARIPRDHWLEDWEKEKIVDFFDKNTLEGYRRITYMMQDADVVAVSPSTVYRVLHAAGRLDRWNRKPSSKGSGFEQPQGPHQHWHVDIAYLNISATFYYLCSVLDGYSRAIIHWEIREAMKETDVETIVQRARERVPRAKPRIISDNGPQFISKDFKEFIRITGMTHVRTSPYYPQSNGKIERWHKTLKTTTIRPNPPGSLDEARQLVEKFVNYYNKKRLHSAIGYIAPLDKLAGREEEIFKLRDIRLEKAREERRKKRQMAKMKEKVA